MAGKRIVNAYKTIDKTQAYALKEAVKIVKSNATAKFDETIDVAINLGVDPKHAGNQCCQRRTHFRLGLCVFVLSALPNRHFCVRE